MPQNNLTQKNLLAEEDFNAIDQLNAKENPKVKNYAIGLNNQDIENAIDGFQEQEYRTKNAEQTTSLLTDLSSLFPNPKEKEEFFGDDFDKKIDVIRSRFHEYVEGEIQSWNEQLEEITKYLFWGRVPS